MKTAVIAMALCLVSQARAYDGTLDVLKYANALIDDARNQSFGPRYPGKLPELLSGSSTEYVNISEGSLEKQDYYISLDSASYLLDKHGNALAVIMNFNILPHKVNYNYTVSDKETGTTNSGTVLVSVDGYRMSSIMSFIGENYPRDIFFFQDTVGNETVTTDSTDALVNKIINSHWDEAGKGQLQHNYVIYVQSAVFEYHIKEYFS